MCYCPVRRMANVVSVSSIWAGCFRITVPKYATKDPNHRILARQKSRFTHSFTYATRSLVRWWYLLNPSE
jgi:hypothetical protein